MSPQSSQPTTKPPATLTSLAAASHVSPDFLSWAAERETVRPGEDGTLPGMDRYGYGIQSLAWGGPMQTGEASVLEKQDQRERRDLSRVMAGHGKEEVKHGEAKLVGGNETSTSAEEEEVKQQPRERKRDVFRRLFGDEAQKRRLEREMGN